MYRIFSVYAIRIKLKYIHVENLHFPSNGGDNGEIQCTNIYGCMVYEWADEISTVMRTAYFIIRYLLF